MDEKFGLKIFLVKYTNVLQFFLFILSDQPTNGFKGFKIYFWTFAKVPYVNFMKGWNCFFVCVYMCVCVFVVDSSMDLGVQEKSSNWIFSSKSFWNLFLRRPYIFLFFGARSRNDRGFFIKFGKHISPLKNIGGYW